MHKSKYTTKNTSDYFIHKNWTDQDIRTFRKIVRLHNITIRYVISKIKDKKKMWEQIKLIQDPLKLLYYYEHKIGYQKNMEKWSAIHNTFKFFDLERPPSYEKITSNKELLEHIKLMNKVKNYCKKHDLELSLRGLKINVQQKKLLGFCEEKTVN